MEECTDGHIPMVDIPVDFLYIKGTGTAVYVLFPLGLKYCQVPVPESFPLVRVFPSAQRMPEHLCIFMMLVFKQKNYH